MSKQYGLIDPKANKTAKQGINKHAAFESDSDSDSPHPKTSVNIELGESQKRQVKAAQAKVLAEDPTIYQYDELYDDMDNKRKESKSNKSKEERKPKYIGKLLETADKRKKEQESRVERQVQKEREAEGEMFKDKESFVTSAYRAKLEEMKKAEENEKREEYLENLGDVTKQSDLGGFYRHIYSQKMGEGSENKNIIHEKAECDEENSSASDEETKQMKCKDDSDSNEEERARLEALKSKEAGQSRGRRYRKRRSDDEDNDENEKNDFSKKVHLQSNLDADSDFSIDSNSSSSESEHSSGSKHDNDNRHKDKNNSVEKSPVKKVQTEDLKIAANGVDNGVKSTKANGNKMIKVEAGRTVKEINQKKAKIDIWKKRTVDGVFEAALQKYYERKAARESG